MGITRTLLAVSISAALVACGGGSSGGSSLKFDQESYAFTGAEDAAVAGAVSATGSNSISYTVTNAAAHGVFALNGDGTFTYTPNADYHGQDSVQVQASAGSKQAQVTINFEVTPVNDAPVLTSSTFSVTSGKATTASLQVTDADGDDLTFTLVKAPENGTLTLTPAGEATYTHNELEEVEGSFTVSFTDGVIATPIEAVIDLKSAMVTNADKRSYYYSLNSSHIKSAESIKATLADDNAVDDVNIDLAAGYYAAGFDEKAEAVIAEIIPVYTKAYAYRAAGRALDARGLHVEAAALRAKAEENFNIYLADKGLNFISSNDASFLLTLNNHFLDAGQIDESRQLMTRVNLYAETVREDEHSTAYGRFLSSMNFYAEDTIEAYLVDKTDDNRQRAIEAVQQLASLAEKTGYRLETRGDYKDQPTDRVKALYVTWAAEMFFNIDAVDQAKKYTALALSLYGQTGFDSANPYEASPYSVATTATYQYPLELLAGLFEGLYPSVTPNAAVAVLEAAGDADDVADAKSVMFSYQIVNDMIGGDDVDTAVEEAETTLLASDDYKELYQTMVEYRPTQPRAATLLFGKDQQAAGLALLNKASDLLTSEDYIVDVASTHYVTGWLGCYRLTELQLNHGGDAQAQADKCESMVGTYYTTDAGRFTTSNAISAHRDLMGTMAWASDADGVAAAATAMLAEVARLDELSDRTDGQVDVSGYQLKFGMVAQSRVTLDTALTGLGEMIKSDDVDVLEDALEILADDLLKNGEAKTGYSYRYGYVHGLKRYVTSIDNYAELYKGTMDAILPHVQALTTKALTLSDKDLQDMMADLVRVNFYAGEYDVVAQLISNKVNGEADKLNLNAAVAGYYANWDDFPGSDIANVDTDHDGKPNFFIAGVTQEEIDASSLVLDEDSDNDGTPDTEDDTPLGE